MEKEDIERMELMCGILSHLRTQLKVYLNKEIPVEIKFDIANTGITPISIPTISDGWVHHTDLGGRSYTISLNFPNCKTIKQVLRKLEKDERKRNKKSS